MGRLGIRSNREWKAIATMVVPFSTGFLSEQMVGLRFIL